MRSRPQSDAPPAPLRVLICPDKFKGTLTAPEAAEAMAAGWRAARPADRIELFPMSDGGDGFGELVAQRWGAQERVAETVDAAHRPLRARWWWNEQSRTAIVESAQVVGLAMLPPGRFHPFDLDTYGLGLLLRQIRQLTPRTWVIGLGGSATNDAGFGMARALGWRFLDERGAEIEYWPHLARLRRVVGFGLRWPGRWLFATDVRNPLLGRRGATRVYGPQKGIRSEEMPAAEAAHQQLVQVLQTHASRRVFAALRAGGGAAGGLGFGLSVFVGGALGKGLELFADWFGLDRRLREADLVITGEGAIDETSLAMGKVVGGVARECRRIKRPCVALAGVVLEPERARDRLTAVHAVAPTLASPEESCRDAARWLRELARRVASSWR